MKQQRWAEGEEYLILNSEQDGVLCRFILKENFTNGVIASGNYHFHSAWEMHLPVRGEMRVMAGDRELLVQPGEVCLIPPQVSHYVYGDERAYRLGFRFTCERAGKAESRLWEKFAGAFGGLDCVQVLRCPLYEKYLCTAAENLRRELPGFMTAELLFLSLYELVVLLGGEAGCREKNEDVSDEQLGEQIEEYLNQNYSRKLYPDELAAKLDLSRRQTERIIRRIFGMTFTELVNRKRLTAAKLLLKNTALSVEEIARKVGYADQNYFYRRFSAAFHATPGSYRRQGANE